jgi:hypothetical protein
MAENSVQDQQSSLSPVAAAKLMFKLREQKDRLAKQDAQIAAMQTEVDAAKVATAEAAKKSDGITGQRIKELEQELRVTRYRKVFDKLATERGAPPEVHDVLWDLAKVKVEGDEPDVATIGTLLDEQKKLPAQGRLFGVVEPQPDNGKSKPIVKPGVASGQGADGTTIANKNFEYQGDDDSGRADDRFSDPAWVWRNWDKIAEASASKIERGEV